MKRSKLTITAAVVVVCACVLAGMAVAQQRKHTSYQTISSAITNPGVPFTTSEMTSRDRAFLGSMHASLDVTRLGALGDKAFYLGQSSSGGGCFFTGPTADPTTHFTSGGCGNGLVFPSAKLPILDDSSFWSPVPAKGSSRVVYLLALGGIAADGIASVGVVDRNGNYLSAPVQDNLYRLHPSDRNVSVSRLIAKDETGKVVYQMQIGR